MAQATSTVGPFPGDAFNTTVNTQGRKMAGAAWKPGSLHSDGPEHSRLLDDLEERRVRKLVEHYATIIRTRSSNKDYKGKGSRKSKNAGGNKFVGLPAANTEAAVKEAVCVPVVHRRVLRVAFYSCTYMTLWSVQNRCLCSTEIY